MVTQKAISARIDKKLLQELDLEVAIGTGNRNKIINDAVRMYMDFLDTQRQCAVIADLQGRYAERELFLARWFNKIF